MKIIERGEHKPMLMAGLAMLVIGIIVCFAAFVIFNAEEIDQMDSLDALLWIVGITSAAWLVSGRFK